MKRLIPLLALAAACASPPPVPASAPPPHPLDWMSGCWQTANGGYREVWSPADHGYLFGYALTLRDGRPVFFEQSRIDPGEVFTFNAYPAGEGPTQFTETARTESSITFSAPEHDYPQVVAYERTRSGLSARISLMDGSKRQDFVFRACAN
ncbi:MAG: hypothetical protein KDA53_05430 [Hyphomonas sp.]|nr:hypothetical protein [Hyphomonas sp.]